MRQNRSGGDHFHRLAEFLRPISGDDAAAYFHEVGNMLNFWNGIPKEEQKYPVEAVCPYCYEEKGPRFKMRVVEVLCKDSREYRENGYRTRWKCTNPKCGEMEFR